MDIFNSKNAKLLMEFADVYLYHSENPDYTLYDKAFVLSALILIIYKFEEIQTPAEKDIENAVNNILLAPYLQGDDKDKIYALANAIVRLTKPHV